MTTEIGGRQAIPLEQFMGPRPPLVYRIYGAGGRLLYVGMTTNALAARLADHQGKLWWDPAGYVTAETFEDAAECARAERRAIQNESPSHNSVRPVVRQLALFPKASFDRLRRQTAADVIAAHRAMSKVWAADARGNRKDERGAA
jgi:hypothetical protein